MGSIASMVGIGPGAGAQGLGFTPQSSQLQMPVTTDQAQASYNPAQAGINNQAAFLAAIQGQNGIGNQSAVYNQLAGIANGTGPNPAIAQLAQSTGQNTANQAALMAGQRGTGANAGLIARQAAQQGAANQQNAIGQGASLQAQQSLNAVNSMGNLASQQVANQAAATGAYTGATQSEQQLLLNQVNAQNQALNTQQGNLNTNNTALAQTGAKTQAGLLSGVAGGLLGFAKGGAVMPHYDQGTPTGGVQSPSLGLNTQINAAPPPAVPNGPPTGPKSFAGKNLKGSSQGSSVSQNGDIGQSVQNLGNTIGTGISKLFSSNPAGATTMDDGSLAGESNNFGAATPAASADNNFGAGSFFGVTNQAHGGKVPAMVSPGEIYLKPEQAKKVAEGKANPKKIGEKIKGKAKVPGDSLKNDTVKKNLDAGGVVIKRSVAMDDDVRKAAQFVAASLGKGALRRGK